MPPVCDYIFILQHGGVYLISTQLQFEAQGELYLPAPSPRRSLLLIALSFVLWGILRSLDDLLVALFHASATLHYATAMLIHFSFFSAYLVTCIPAGIYVRNHGYRNSTLVSLTLMAIGSAICVPGLWLYSFPFCLAGIFFVGAGIAFLQTSANPCIGLLGPETKATTRLLFMHCFIALGCLLSPLAGPTLFGHWSRHTLIPLVFPQTQLAIIYSAITALLFLASWLVWRFFTIDLPITRATGDSPWPLLRDRRVSYGIAMTFLYVGTEATLLAHTIPYLANRYGSSFLPGEVATLLSVYWGAIIVSRICVSQIPHHIHARTLLQVAAIVAFCLIQVSIYWKSPGVSLCILATGLCNAMIFPCIFTLTVAGMKVEQLPHASALLSTAMCGGAVLPVVSGALADHFGIVAAFALPSVVYLFIALCTTMFFPADYYLRKI